MTIKKCESKEDFLKKLHNNGYDKLTTFLTYPKYDKNHTGSKDLELCDSYIYENDKKITYSDKFLKDINIDNGIIFIGLNAATRDTSFDEDHSVFQTMHDANIKNKKNNHTNDTSIAYSVYNNPKAYGSFAFDVIDNFPQNNINQKTIDDLSKQIKNTRFEYPDKIKDLSNLEKENINSSDLMKMFKNYYVPAFISIMQMLKPTKLICFGNNSFSLVSAIVKSTEIHNHSTSNIEVIEVPHYGAYTKDNKGLSYDDKSKIIQEAIK